MAGLRAGLINWSDARWEGESSYNSDTASAALVAAARWKRPNAAPLLAMVQRRTNGGFDAVQCGLERLERCKQRCSARRCGRASGTLASAMCSERRRRSSYSCARHTQWNGPNDRREGSESSSSNPRRVKSC